MARLVRGDRLAPDVQAAVLARYVHRLTRENRDSPGARLARSGRTLGRLPSDRQWLASHAFHVRADGQLDERARACAPAFMAEEPDDA